MDISTINTVITVLISIGAIPFLVKMIKKWIPKAGRFAPIITIVLAAIYVLIGNILGLNPDFNTTLSQLMLALGVSGGAVLTYDTVKTTIKGK